MTGLCKAPAFEEIGSKQPRAQVKGALETASWCNKLCERYSTETPRGRHLYATYDF